MLSQTDKSESAFTRSILSILERRHGGMNFKHADLFSTGVPDISHVSKGNTWWLELKVIEQATYEKFYEAVTLEKNKLQFINMRRLDKCSRGKAWYLALALDLDKVIYARPRTFHMAEHRNQIFGPEDEHEALFQILSGRYNEQPTTSISTQD